ncbi:MAG: lipopolysaccharide biosynthesis protein [Terracidiphilus sp.]
MLNGRIYNTKSLQARIVSGSVVLLSGSGLTTAINLAYNIVVAQFLGPRGFGHATVVYTLLTVLSAVTLSFQIISTKLVAQQGSPEEMAAVYRSFHKSAWACGLLIAVVLLLFQQSISTYLNLPDPALVGLLAIGAAFYVPLGSRRGYIQGTYGFCRLASNLVLEGAVRLGGSFLLVHSGFGVRGVIAANAAAIAVAYFAAAPKLAARIVSPLRLGYALRETCQALVFFSGQVLINNSDIVLVKHFFPAQTAGLYAAVAMVGRVIFAFSSAVVNTTFPLVAGTRDQERKDLKVIATSLLLVFGSGSLLAFGLCITPAWIWTKLFGAGFQIAGEYNLPSLLALYALATVVYSLSVVIITFEMSYKIANTSWVQLAFSGVLIAGICRFHSSLHQVILVQLYLMAALFVLVAIPFLIDSLTNPHDLFNAAIAWPLRLVRRVSEDEVIAEFLKSDFENPAFKGYQATMHALVTKPNLEDASENAKRRALLFIRHLALWKEIPQSTQWYEVEVRESDLDHIRVFPRAQWRKLARGNFSITEVVENLHERQHLLEAPFLLKIASIGDELRRGESELGAVILIGLDENKPLAILDGNHRLVAAMLASPKRLQRLKFICGLSPRMTECCWYNTNLVTLFRYATNVLAQVIHNPEAELARLLQGTG